MNFHKLDNVGTFFASTYFKHNPDVFRFAITMDELIDEETLKKALMDWCLPRMTVGPSRSRAEVPTLRRATRFLQCFVACFKVIINWILMP